MDGQQRLPIDIVEALERGATIVTGNHRAARTLRRYLDLRNRERGLVNWQPAAAIAWETWTTALWHRLLIEGHATQLVLTRSQEHVVWRRIIEADDQLASLKTVDSLAELACETWRLTCSYDGQKRLRSFPAASSDTRYFQRWAAAFERRCQIENFASQSQLEDLLRGFFETGRIRIPEGVVLVGIDAMNPAQEALVRALQQAGSPVSELRLEVEPETCLLATADNYSEELSAAAAWARSFVDEHPGARVAVIVPGLERERSAIDRVFRAILAPALQDIFSSDESAAYEFSLGKPLSETPLVSSALDLLRWCSGSLALERVSVLLLSPYFAMRSEERGARAEFDAFELRQMRMLRPEIASEALLGAVEHSKRRQQMQRFAAAMRRMGTSMRKLQGMSARSHSRWAEHMREFLEAASWGAATHESSVEFQMRRKWESALDEMAALDFEGPEIEFEQALSAIERIARQTMFAPESRDASVQVMGPLEAAGTIFGAVWVLRAGEFDWPVNRETNPLLPWPIQRDLGMPATDIERDTAHARRMMKRIANSAPTVIFSYALKTEEGHQRATPALSGLRLKSTSVKDFVCTSPERTLLALEETDDAAPVGRLPDRTIRGGARILQLQAACGFRAFAEHRLWATELHRIEPGLDARESGTVVHKVLEIFWNKVKTQETLRSMTEDEREDMLGWSIAEALRRVEESSAPGWEIAYVAIQRERLRRLIRGWLELEMERAVPFEVKLNEKAFKDVMVGPLSLSVRMDRVDLVEGGEVLIDYKTGLASPSEWLTDRPDAPQLPLYAILSNAEQLQGIAFGFVRAGDGRTLQGYEARNGILPKPVRLKEAATLSMQIERWREVLVKLAEEFYRGEARVRPKNYPGTCDRCGQRLLCRLDVTSLQADEEDSVATEAGRA